MNLRDTIAAISTPPGRGGIGIVRISGELSRHISDQILRLRAALTPRVATVADLMEEDGETVDEVVATFFAASKSFTGEDVLEISCHGSPVILGHCLTRAMTCGARLAEPGEFTLRAFVNGRIDLPRAEAVRDLIESTTLYQARVAAQQAQGSVSRMLTPIKADLLELIALLEAGIDFAEDDISVAPTTEILRRIDPVIERTEALAASFRYGNLVRNGFSLAIVGSPNVGKSSLFNRLLQRDRAIVTAIAGTTRDLVSETAEFDGIPIRLVDTAGIRETTETIERLGIEKSYEAMADADLTILVLDGTQQVQHDLRERAHLTIANKADLPGFLLPEGCIAVSALTGQGIDELRTAIHRAMAPESGADLQGGFITTLRHHTLLNETVAMLRKAREAAVAPLPHELLLLDLYCALQPLDAITGATTADDILNRIFSSFCIGK